MTGITRRQFLAIARAAGLLGALGGVPAISASTGRVVVIGGGFGGATCARYLRQLDPTLQVTLIERNTFYYTCPFSNLVLAGLRTLGSSRHTYQGLKAQSVDVMHDLATEIDPVKRQVTLARGQKLGYDRLVVAPGIELRFDAVPGYNAASSAVMPHAWQAGAQTTRLKNQLMAMQDGGLVIIAAPGEPYRCPPGPYERACLIAHYLIQHKPKSKILILDAKDTFSKQELFMQGWQKRYPGMIEWVAGSAGGIVEAVNANTRTLVTESGFTEHNGNVVNFIPPQRAAVLAQRTDLTDKTGWCPVDQLTFASQRQPDIHVLGDAAIAGSMPKSAFSANSQAKVCAAAIVASLRGINLPEPSYANTCYSLVAPDYGISISAVYHLRDGKIVPVAGAGGVSPKDVGPGFRAKEAAHAHAWYTNTIAEVFG